MTDAPRQDDAQQASMREGFTTGACAAAAARAATHRLVHGNHINRIATVLPMGREVSFAVERCEMTTSGVRASVIKDAGDDPDCTHGAELVAEVVPRARAGVVVVGGEGIARVTKPGLGLEVGGFAINPVPHENIVEMVTRELMGTDVVGAHVTIHVPGGEEMATKTLNARLGLLGGISILGTTGIVKPYSTAAFRASVFQAIDLAVATGHETVILTTGGRSERRAMELYPALTEEAFVQMGDFVGAAARHACASGIGRVAIVGMMGKLSKMADGRMMTHAKGSRVNMALLASLAAEANAPDDIVRAIAEANTARHVLELTSAARCHELPRLICREVVRHLERHAPGLLVEAVLIDFEGVILGRHPMGTHRSTAP